MAGVKKVTAANKSNKNVKTAKNTTSRERAHKAEKSAAKKEAEKKSAPKKSTPKKTVKAEKKKPVRTGYVPLPTASTTFTNRGLMARHNEAQRSMFRERPAAEGTVNYSDFIQGVKPHTLIPERSPSSMVDRTPRYAAATAWENREREKRAFEDATRITDRDNPLAGLGVKNSQTPEGIAAQSKAQSNIDYIVSNWNAFNSAQKKDNALYITYNQGINDKTAGIFDDAYKQATGQEKLNLLSAAVYYNGYDAVTTRYINQLSSEEKKTLNKTLTASMYGEYNEDNYKKGEADLSEYYDALKREKGNQYKLKQTKEEGYGFPGYAREKIKQAIGKLGAGINKFIAMTAADISKMDREITVPWKGVDLVKNDILTNIVAVTSNFVNFALVGMEQAFKNDAALFYKFTHKKDIDEKSLAEISERLEKWAAHVDDDYWNEVYLTEAKAEMMNFSDNAKFAGQVIDGVVSMLPSIAVSLVNPTVGLATFGTMAGGQYAQEAYESGASLPDAVTYGTVGGAAEALTERLFTGFGYFGKGVISTIGKKTGVQMINPATVSAVENFGNSMGGRILKRFVAGGGEATEEMIMELVQPFIERATYNPEAANATWDEVAAAGGLGFVVAEILGLPAAALGVYNVEGGKRRFMSEFRAGLKDAGVSEGVIDEVTKQAKLVTKGKGTIASGESQAKETSVVSDLSTVAHSTKEAANILKELAKGKQEGEKVSVAVVSDEGAKILTATVDRNGSIGQTSLVDTNRVGEYKEKSKRLSAARNTAEKTGTQLNVSPEVIKTVSSLEKAIGSEIVFESNPRAHENGRYENGKIYVNVNSKNPVAQIVAHELTHHIAGTSSYKDLQKYVFKYYKDSVGYKQDDVVDLYDRYGYELNSESDVNEEVMAVFVEKKLLTDFDTINAVAENRTLAQKIIDWLNDVIQKLTGNKEQVFFVKARNMYKKAIQESKGEKAPKKTKYSIAEDSKDAAYMEAVKSGDMETAQRMEDKEDIRYSISGDGLSEESTSLSAEGIFDEYFSQEAEGKYKGNHLKEIKLARKFAGEIAEKIEKDFGVIGKKKTVRDMVMGVAEKIYLGKGFTEQDVFDIAKTAYENSGERVELDDSVVAAKKELRNVRIHIPADVRGELKSVGGIVALNRKGLGNKTSFTFSKENAIPLDEMRSILVEHYPNLFPEDTGIGISEIADLLSMKETKEYRLEADEQELSRGMSKEKLQEILKDSIDFVRGELQFYRDNVKEYISAVSGERLRQEKFEKRVTRKAEAAAEKEVKQYKKKKDKEVSQYNKSASRTYRNAHDILNRRYRNISKFQSQRSERLTKKEQQLKNKAEEAAYRKKLEQRKKAVLEQAKQKPTTDKSPEDSRVLLYQQNKKAQEARRLAKREILAVFGDVEQKHNPSYVNVLLAEEAGINKDMFYGIYDTIRGIRADQKDGKVVMGTRRKKVINYIQSLDLTEAQKTFLYLDIAKFKIANKPKFTNGGKYVPTLGNKKGRLNRAVDEILLDIYIGNYNSEQLYDLIEVYYGDKDTTVLDVDIAVTEITEILSGYMQVAAEAREAARAKISPSTGKERKSVKEMRENAQRGLKKYLLDEGEAFTRMEKDMKYFNLYSYYNGAKQAGAVATGMLFQGGQYDLSGNWVGRSLHDIMKPILKKGDTILPGKKDNTYLDAFEKYMFELHNIDRIAWGKPVTGSTLSESHEVVAELLEAHPEFEEIGEEVHGFLRNILDMAVVAGRISQEDADYFKAKYPHYVPSFRVEMVRDRSGKIIKRTHAIIKTADGGTQALAPLWEQIERRTREMVREIKKNELAVHLVEGYYHNENAALKFMELDSETAEDTGYKELEDLFDNFGYEDPTVKRGDNAFIPAYLNGEQHNIYIKDENILYAWDRIGRVRDEILVERALRNINNFKRGTLTTYNPVFVLTNGIKDLQDMFVYNLHAEKLPFYYGKALAGIAFEKVSNDMNVAEEWRRYLAGGAANASIFEYENTVGGKKKNTSKLYDHTLKHIDNINFVVEQAPRFAVYLETKDRLTRQKKKGRSRYSTRDIEMQALLAAADATLNFGRSGTLVKYLNTYGATFLNAGVQGTDRLIRTIKQTKSDSALRTAYNVAGLIVKMAIMGIAPTLANWFLYYDDPEYEEIPDYVKISQYVFKVGDDWVKIPKGRVLAWVNSLFYLPYGYMEGDYSVNEALREELGVFMDNIAPNNPVTSSIVSPLLQVWANKNFFGGEIVPSHLMNDRKYKEYDKETTELSKKISQIMYELTVDESLIPLINWSPMKMDFVIDQMTGILGDLFLPMMKKGQLRGTPEDILKRTVKQLVTPLEKKFTFNTIITNKSASEYYRLRDYLTRADEITEGESPETAALKYLTKRHSEVVDLGKELDAVYDDETLSDQEREDKILELKDKRNQLYKEIYVKTLAVREDARTSYKAGDDIKDTYENSIIKTQGAEYYINNHGTDGLKSMWEKVKGSGINAETAVRVYAKMNDYTADKDSNGKTINGSKREKIVNYIQSLDLTASQKAALYRSQGYSENTMPEFTSGGSTSTPAESTSFDVIGGDYRVTSTFGPRKPPTAGASSYHRGIDLACKSGTPLKAMESGTVTKASDTGNGYGLEVEVTSASGAVTKFAHLSSASVSVGDVVEKGEVIAKVGSSGVSTGAHLHLGYNVNGEWVNPANYFDIPGAGSGSYSGSYQATVTAGSGRSGGKKSSGKKGGKSGGKPGGKSGFTHVTTARSIEPASNAAVASASKALSNAGYTPSPKTPRKYAPGYTNLPTAATVAMSETRPTAIGYNKSGISTTTTSRTSRKSMWYDSILG